MATTDLFGWLDALWNKTRPEGTPPVYMMHRFLAAERDLATAARYLQVDLAREPALVFATWQALLPKGASAPRLAYVAPKRPKAAEALTERMMHVLAERRSVVEEMQELVELAGRGGELYIHFGIEPPAATEEEEVVQVKHTGGLLDL